MNSKYKKAGLTIVISVLLIAAAAAGTQPKTAEAATFQRFETRCGWFDNPTPANAWLFDSQGQWTIGIQGGYQAEGDWPDFGPKQWVKTNVNYGYGCACLRLRVNRETHEVIEIASSRARPLSACRRDRTLRKWDRRGFK